MCAGGMSMLVGIAYRRLRPVGTGIYFGSLVPGYFILSLGSYLAHYYFLAVPTAAIGTYLLYAWWNGGGGHGVRRRIARLRGLMFPARKSITA